MATIRVELPLEEAELIQKALGPAVAAGEVATGAEFYGEHLASATGRRTRRDREVILGR